MRLAEARSGIVILEISTVQPLTEFETMPPVDALEALGEAISCAKSNSPAARARYSVEGHFQSSTARASQTTRRGCTLGSGLRREGRARRAPRGVEE